MAIDEQKKYSEPTKFEQPEIGAKHADVEKLRQEIAEMRKQLAEKKAEMRPGERRPEERKPEIFVEPAQEGAKSAGQAETASIGQAPAIQPAGQAAQALVLDSQVKTLCELAFQKGVEVALKAAQELNNPYVLDEFHDTLVDQLYDRLISEKKIERE